MTTASQFHSYLSPRTDHVIGNDFQWKDYKHLRSLGVHLDGFNGSDTLLSNAARVLSQNIATMDSIQPTITTPSIPTPLQFLQFFNPGWVHIITAARKADKVIGQKIVGSPEDEEIVQGVLELLGTAQPYDDYADIALASWNPNFERRSVVRFAQAIRVGVIESKQAARINVDTANEKRTGATLALEIIRNYIAFYGFNNGANRTYGFLNDPNLLPYNTVPNGASGSPLWVNKTFAEIVKDITTAIVGVRTQSQDQIDPEEMELELVLASAVVDFLSTPSTQIGYTVRKWMTDTYPRIRVVSAPELTAANGGANVGYMQAVRVQDSSTDGGSVWDNLIQTKFLMLGVEQRVQSYLEGYLNAMAGALCKRPFAVYRFTGI
jgi:hypothetical protein